MISQKISRVYSTDEGNFMGRTVKKNNSLLFYIFEKRPYIVGIQLDKDTYFFDLEVLKQLQKTADDFLHVALEKQYLKDIDL